MSTPPDPHAINLAPVVDEVTAAFVAYEAALVAHDVAGMEAAFWDDPRVVRYGIADAQRGPAALARFRRASGPIPGGRVLHDTVITTFGTDLATAWTHFTDDAGGIGRQSQVWARLDGTWRIVAAHVSRVGHEVRDDMLDDTSRDAFDNPRDNNASH